MDRWAGRMAFVPDVNEVAGAAIVKELTSKGVHVIAMAASPDLLQSLGFDVKGAGTFYPVVGDASNEKDIVAAFTKASKVGGGIDILVNNVDAFTGAQTTGGRMSETDWKAMFNRNMQAFRMSIRCFLNSLQARKVDDGHIIHVNSLENHRKSVFPDEATYFASKYGLAAIIKGLRRKFLSEKSKIRITIVNIGLVANESPTMPNAGCGERLPGIQDTLSPKDVADVVLFALAAPAHVQVHELNVKSIAEE